jgi:prephenate dehydratase
MKKSQKIAFQGELGAFSQVTALQMAGNDIEPSPFQTFEAAFQSVVNGKTQAAAIPIENTLHGSVHENYDHLLKYGLEIHGETFVRIVHNLIAPPRVKLADIVTVYSHPVALNQCRTFFEQNPNVAKTPFYDTAGSVKMLMEKRLPASAAIASETAAKIYGAKILKRSIEDDRENYTRFFLLRKPSTAKRKPTERETGRWKTSIAFTIRNVPGGLFRSLSAFSLRDLNLTKIESRPLRGKPWEYMFYLDFHGHVDDPVTKNAISHLSELADMLRILGCYPAAA